jgi:hypothetical protein
VKELLTLEDKEWVVGDVIDCCLLKWCNNKPEVQYVTTLEFAAFKGREKLPHTLKMDGVSFLIQNKNSIGKFKEP